MESDEILDDDGTEKHLGNLLVEQVEFCDVLLLNKCDLVDEPTLAEIESTLEVLQPRAEIIRTKHGRVDPNTIIETDRFDFEEASHSAGWIKELQEPHESAEEEHGVTSFVFEARGEIDGAIVATESETEPLGGEAVLATSREELLAAGPRAKLAHQPRGCRQRFEVRRRCRCGPFPVRT